MAPAPRVTTVFINCNQHGEVSSFSAAAEATPETRTIRWRDLQMRKKRVRTSADSLSEVAKMSAALGAKGQRR